MKFLIALVMILSLNLISQTAKAEDSGSQAANFKACVSSDSSWFGRWGQYLAGYDIYSAQAYCRSNIWNHNSNALSMGCFIDSQWRRAGYYCSEPNHGNR